MERYSQRSRNVAFGRTARLCCMPTHLRHLEAESIHILREVVAECERPVMLYSIGKDSATMLHLARKAFHPAPPPFPMLHVASGWDFADLLAHRDRTVREYGLKLIVAENEDAERQGINPFDTGSALYSQAQLTEPLKRALTAHDFDAAFGGGRRDEEKARAKERIFSFRNAALRWEPKAQRPELWNQYNGRIHPGESVRAFPLSNWTEMDVWRYIEREGIALPPLYFAADRPVVERDGVLLMRDDARMALREGEREVLRRVRFRTLGCWPFTGGVESEADSVGKIIAELENVTTSERQGRVIDHAPGDSMEKKKQEGYF